ncbi:MAG: TRAP transporter large permease [Spirochaetales bacterium]|jgi:tripartite ATP-independent transporter DctM subunit|nr:TRAP transporter large permease [Spirochaetales bacterium]
MNSIILLLGAFFALIAIRVPLAFALALSSLAVIWQLDLPFVSLANQLFTGINSFPLLAVPFFLILGNLLTTGGITERLIDVSNAWVGHIKGGLAHVNVVVSMLFAGLSGSPASDAAGEGAVIIPAMLKSGFDKDFTVAITACSSVLGAIIPPSITMVLYGAMGQVSVGALFLSGIVPGILIGFSQMGYVAYVSHKRNYPALPRTGWKQRFIRTAKALPPLSVPLIILGGITAGIYTATEAAAVALLVGFVLVYGVYRDASIKDFPKALITGVVTFSLPMFCVACACVLGWLIAFLDAPAMIARTMLSVTTSYFGIYMMLIIFLLIIGTFLSPVASVIIFLPIIQEMGNAAGADPVHLGVIVTVLLSLGQVTPPYGICLLIDCQIADLSMPKAFKATIPILLLALVVVIIGIAFPELFLFIPKLFMPDVFQ